MSEPDNLEEQKLKLEERKLKLEEYKLWVEDLSRISARRGTRTTIYVTVNSIALTAIALFLRGIDPDEMQRWTLMSLFPFLVIGITACLAWRQSGIAYRRLASLRVYILREIEELPEMNLSVKAFHAEDELYPREEFGEADPRKGINYADLDLWLPTVLLAIYIVFYIGLSTFILGA
jgi:hypothetical protein